MRSVVSAFQKLRKSSGLTPSDRVEMFYEVKTDGQDLEAQKVVDMALNVHKDSVLKRLKQMPLPASHRPAHSVLVGKESLAEPDICKGTFVVYLTRPQASVDLDALTTLAGGNKQTAEMLRMYLCSVEHSRLEAAPSLTVNLDAATFTLLQGTHYFSSAES
eukprot:gene19476-23870_t